MKRLKPFLYILCGLYILVMLWLLFGQRIGGEHAGSYWQELRGIPIPFETVFRFGRIILTGEPAYLVPHAVQNLAGNVVMFMPIGFFLPCFFARCSLSFRLFFTKNSGIQHIFAHQHGCVPCMISTRHKTSCICVPC